jgi:hypothetical protein
MKNLLYLFFISFFYIFTINGQTEEYNLKSKNLHKKVRKTIEHYYKYDDESGGFVKTSVNIDRYNDDGFLQETYSLYNSKFSKSTPVKKLYNYNSNGLLIGTQDISDNKSKYSTEYKFIYDSKDNLIKRESIYKDGSKYYTVYKNDRKGRVLNKKEYNKKEKLTAEVNYSYKGKKTTETRTSFSSSDGSIIGNYITTYNGGIKTDYKSESKYGNSSNKYEYDKKGNLISSSFSGKTSSRNTYDYIYDKKDNWIKKHYRSGKYQYFYFREIHFDNGDVTGNTNFDKQFINRLGNFANVEVVPLKKKELKKVNKNNVDKKGFSLSDKNWDFEYVYLNKKVTKLKGTLALKINNNSTLDLNSKSSYTIQFKGSTFTFNFNVSNYEKLEDKYKWTLSNTNNESGILQLFKTKKVLKDKGSGDDFFVNGLLTIVEKSGSTMSFYLK